MGGLLKIARCSVSRLPMCGAPSRLCDIGGIFLGPGAHNRFLRILSTRPFYTNTVETLIENTFSQSRGGPLFRPRVGVVKWIWAERADETLSPFLK